PRSSTASCSSSRCCSHGPPRIRSRGPARTSMTEASAALASYERKKAELRRSFPSAGSGELRLAKSTISNLFRYEPRRAAGRRVSLAGFDGVLGIDAAGRTADVEGLATYSTVVTACLERGLLPLVAPELKHITVGGATVGIGIEST